MTCEDAPAYPQRGRQHRQRGNRKPARARGKHGKCREGCYGCCPGRRLPKRWSISFTGSFGYSTNGGALTEHRSIAVPPGGHCPGGGAFGICSDSVQYTWKPDATKLSTSPLICVVSTNPNFPDDCSQCLWGDGGLPYFVHLKGEAKNYTAPNEVPGGYPAGEAASSVVGSYQVGYDSTPGSSCFTSVPIPPGGNVHPSPGFDAATIDYWVSYGINGFVSTGIWRFTVVFRYWLDAVGNTWRQEIQGTGNPWYYTNTSADPNDGGGGVLRFEAPFSCYGPPHDGTPITLNASEPYNTFNNGGTTYPASVTATPLWT